QHIVEGKQRPRSGGLGDMRMVVDEEVVSADRLLDRLLAELFERAEGQVHRVTRAYLPSGLGGCQRLRAPGVVPAEHRDLACHRANVSAEGRTPVRSVGHVTQPGPYAAP